jgi:hypothetical protein
MLLTCVVYTGVLQIARDWSGLSESLVHQVERLILKVATGLAVKQLDSYKELQKAVLQATTRVTITP